MITGHWNQEAIAVSTPFATAQNLAEVNFGICDEPEETEGGEDDSAVEGCAVPDSGDRFGESSGSETEASQTADSGGSQSLSWETVTTLPMAMVIPVVIAITLPAVWIVVKRRSNSHL
ncbi:hypothetical protein NEA10_12805 [Phormidium yuhuli AB48]|uniref:Uncharacterized protein n=1 Tax=Phormidium yuhuli AB48 TaxID=2940671 RepID=A0ABY5ALQ6_9CYAN|nr:hypothetical protein [Phormidium yuhuli]USR89755.1 hypothetical protein NEA10_12805 [Phormidium yuhuli AB48]